MKIKVSTVFFVHMLTFIFLVAFQALFILFSPVQDHWEIYAACLVMDGLLLAGYSRATTFRRAGERAHFRDTDEELQRFLDLTRTQQDHWRSTLQGLGGVRTEDLSAGEIAELPTSLNTVKGLPLDLRKDVSETTVESMALSIQSLIQLNRSLMDDLDRVFGFYNQTYLRLKKIQTEYRLNHFRLKETVGFVDQMGKRTNRYSEKLVLEVLDSFQEITRFSAGISTDVMGRIRGLMDSSNPESLDAISRGSAKIHRAMDEFFVDLGRTTTASEIAVAQNLTQMVRVQEMAEAIADFSESIRMISLNLNIEAARSTGHGGDSASERGFHVLATKLSEFAVKAKELAQQQHDVIENASAVMTQSGRAQLTQLEALMAEIPRLKAQLDPFETIISQSYSHFESVVGKMEHLSQAINEKLKAVIGKFQFQDLVRQEQEHILLLFTHIRDLADQVGDKADALEEPVKAEALEALLKTFESLSSTENEKAVLREFRTMGRRPPDAGEADEVTAGSVSLF